MERSKHTDWNLTGQSFDVIPIKTQSYSIQLLERSPTKMIRLVVFCVMLSAITVTRRPVRAHQPITDFASEARRLVHQSNWASVGTISTDASNKGYPFVTLIPVADSKLGAPSTGNIFFYMMEDVFSVLNLARNDKTTFTFTDKNCPSRDVDAESSKCSKAIISGKVKQLAPRDNEHVLAKEAFLSRHPTAASWISPARTATYDTHLRVLDISNVIVLVGTGEYQHVSQEDYYEVTAIETTTVDMDE